MVGTVGESSVATECRHPDWKLDEKGLGVCKACGAEQQFPIVIEPDDRKRQRGQKGKHIVAVSAEEVSQSDLLAGGGEGQMTEELRPTGRLNQTKREELLKIGVDAFAEKYHYRQTGMLVSIYKKLRAGWEPSSRSEPGSARKRAKRAQRAKRVTAEIHPLLQAAIVELPKAGERISFQRKEALQGLFIAVLDLLYPEE